LQTAWSGQDCEQQSDLPDATTPWQPPPELPHPTQAPDWRGPLAAGARWSPQHFEPQGDGPAWAVAVSKPTSDRIAAIGRVTRTAFTIGSIAKGALGISASDVFYAVDQRRFT